MKNASRPSMNQKPSTWLFIPACVLLLCACSSDGGPAGAGGSDAGGGWHEIESTDLCHSQGALCAFEYNGMCEIMKNGAVGGGIYKVEKIEASSVMMPDDAGTAYPPVKRTVARITLSLSAYIWGRKVDSFTGRLLLNDNCQDWIEDESIYFVEGESVITLYPDADTGTYKLSDRCVNPYYGASGGKVFYGCIGWRDGISVEEMQSVFDKAKKPDGTYDCTIPEGQCGYVPQDGGTLR
jgi:hypothetical protein